MGRGVKRFRKVTEYFLLKTLRSTVLARSIVFDEWMDVLYREDALAAFKKLEEGTLAKLARIPSKTSAGG